MYVFSLGLRFLVPSPPESPGFRRASFEVLREGFVKEARAIETLAFFPIVDRRQPDRAVQGRTMTDNLTLYSILVSREKRLVYF
jgi:hypothetical protein